MPAAVVQVCVDPRLNHELLRIQVRQKLHGLHLSADRIFIVNDVAGNVGASFQNTVDFLVGRRDPIVLSAVLHHDDCLAAQDGLRTPLADSAEEMRKYLLLHDIRGPVLTGTILTEHTLVQWSDEPPQRYVPHMFFAR